MKKRTIVIVLAVALLLVLVLAGTAYGVPAPTTPGITAGLILSQISPGAGGSVQQFWFSWVAIVGINGKPDTGSITETILTFDPHGKLVSQISGTEAVTDVIKVSPTTMEFLVFDWGLWYKVVDGGWPGVKKDAWYGSHDPTYWSQNGILAGNIIVH